MRDNGPGINPQALSRIGERFYRPPGQEAPGSGLGLSIVRRIASLHGMQVDFANARDGGSRPAYTGSEIIAHLAKDLHILLILLPRFAG